MIFISHDLKVVRNLCDRVAVMYLGKIVEEGPVEDVFATPRHPYTRALLSSVPEPGQRLDGRIILQGEPPNPAKRPSGCAFHPRCPEASEICRTTLPEMQETGPQCRAACHHLDRTGPVRRAA